MTKSRNPCELRLNSFAVCGVLFRRAPPECCPTGNQVSADSRIHPYEVSPPPRHRRLIDAAFRLRRARRLRASSSVLPSSVSPRSRRRIRSGRRGLLHRRARTLLLGPPSPPGLRGPLLSAPLRETLRDSGFFKNAVILSEAWKHGRSRRIPLDDHRLFGRDPSTPLHSAQDDTAEVGLERKGSDTACLIS